MSRNSDRIRYLEAVCDHWQTGTGTIPDVGELLGIDLDSQQQTYWRSILDGLADEGLIRTAHSLSNAAGWPTARGDAYVEEVRTRRKDPAERRAAAAGGLLGWIDLQDQGSPSFVNIHPAFTTFDLMGDPLGETEIRAAADRLAEDGLIEISSAPNVDPPQVRITKLGQRCADSRLTVDEFLRHERSRASMTTNHFSGQFHSSNIAASSSDFTQTLSPTGDRGDEIRALLDAVLQALPVLDLQEADAASVRRNVEVVRGELEQPQQNGEIVKGMLTRVAEGVASGAGSALGSALNLLVKWELTRMGLPLE